MALAVWAVLARSFACLTLAEFVGRSLALLVHVTEQSMAWLPEDARAACFSALDYSQGETQVGLPLLLGSTAYRYEFRSSYASQKLPPCRAPALISAFAGLPGLHPLVLPFELVTRSGELMGALLAPAAEERKYNPGSVLIRCSDDLIPGAWVQTVFGMIGHDPMLCAGIWEAKRALALGVECTWALFSKKDQSMPSPQPDWPLELRFVDAWLQALGLALGMKEMAACEEEMGAKEPFGVFF